MVALDATRISDVDDLQRALGADAIGRSAAFKVLRGNTLVTLAAVLAERRRVQRRA